MIQTYRSRVGAVAHIPLVPASVRVAVLVAVVLPVRAVAPVRLATGVDAEAVQQLRADRVHRGTHHEARAGEPAVSLGPGEGHVLVELVQVEAVSFLRAARGAAALPVPAQLPRAASRGPVAAGREERQVRAVRAVEAGALRLLHADGVQGVVTGSCGGQAGKAAAQAAHRDRGPVLRVLRRESWH